MYIHVYTHTHTHIYIYIYIVYMQLNVNHQWLKANMLFYIIGHQPQTRGVFRLVRPPTAARNFDPASLRGVGHPEGGEIGTLAFSDASWHADSPVVWRER